MLWLNLYWYSIYFDSYKCIDSNAWDNRFSKRRCLLLIWFDLIWIDRIHDCWLMGLLVQYKVFHFIPYESIIHIEMTYIDRWVDRQKRCTKILLDALKSTHLICSLNYKSTASMLKCFHLQIISQYVDYVSLTHDTMARYFTM